MEKYLKIIAFQTQPHASLIVKRNANTYFVSCDVIFALRQVLYIGIMRKKEVCLFLRISQKFKVEKVMVSCIAAGCANSIDILQKKV